MRHINEHSPATQNATPAPAVSAAALDHSPVAALKALIKITQALVDFSDREGQALAKNDMLDFAIMQDEKTVLTQRYVQMSNEFRMRLEEFRGSDAALLDRLEALQKELAEKSKSNNQVIDRIQTRARQKTSDTLLSAQEMGQSHNLTFIQDVEREERRQNATSAQDEGATDNA